jgi:hypothetical protein
MKDVYLLHLKITTNPLDLTNWSILACYEDVNKLVKRIKEGLYADQVKESGSYIYSLLTDPYDGYEVYEFGMYVVIRRPLY